MPPDPIPAFVNCLAGTAAAARRALEADARFAVHAVEPARLRDAVAAEVERGSERILVCGGDGTIAAAAAVVAGTGVELAILPGGTLNHFARDHGIPTALDEALEVAAGAGIRRADVGWVNDRLFLNTSSVGAYVSFVRRRERLERWLPYSVASFLAGAQILVGLDHRALVLATEGVVVNSHTPLVFIGVGERETALPSLGSRVEGGRRGLHAILVHGRARARVMALALAAAAAGVRRVARTPHLDSFVLDACTVELPKGSTRVSVDGEIVKMATPLRYRIARDAFTLVAP
jgi:diacylglycerol kinase family enzyme